jgi:hypothetical protein
MNDWPQPGSPEAAGGPAPRDEPTGGAASAGHPAVDAAVQAVWRAAQASPADQIPTYQAAHRMLQETLASIDES